jgi:hypothetical protein
MIAIGFGPVRQRTGRRFLKSKIRAESASDATELNSAAFCKALVANYW